MLSKNDKSKSMSDTLYMKENLPLVWSVERFWSVKAAQYAAYVFMKPRVVKDLKLRRIRQLWEGKAGRVDGEEKDAVRLAQIEEAKHERAALRARLDRLDGLLAAVDEEFHGPTIAILREQASRQGRASRG